MEENGNGDRGGGRTMETGEGGREINTGEGGRESTVDRGRSKGIGTGEGDWERRKYIDF